jgi:hypothetical protein
MIFRFVPIFAVSVRDIVGFLGTASVFLASTVDVVTGEGAMTEVDSMKKPLEEDDCGVNIV